MRSAIFFQDVIGEAFYTQTQSCDAEFLERVNFRFAQRPGFTFEGDFFALSQEMLARSRSTSGELFRGQEAWRSTSEVDESKGRPPMTSIDLPVRSLARERRHSVQSLPT